MIAEHLLSTDDQDAWRDYLPERRSVFGSLGYARICQAHRNFSPRLYVLESGEAAISYALLFRSLTGLPFRGETSVKWDAATPDFTGPLMSGSDSRLAAAFPGLRNALFEKEGVVAEFGHLHPWSQARALLQEGCDYNRDIVWVDTSRSPEVLWHEHLAPACRRNISRAGREGVRILTASCDEHVREFYRIYSHTMSRNDAEACYYFSYEFFRAFREELPENSSFFLAEYRDQIVAGALCLHDDTDAFYFLAGADAVFQHVRPMNAVIWELIRWAHGAGKKRLVLGAGYRPNDGVVRFKSTFSHLRQPFYIYKHVHLRQDYSLLERRFREFSGLTTESVGYFPIYRYRPRAMDASTSEREVSHNRLAEMREEGGTDLG